MNILIMMYNQSAFKILIIIRIYIYMNYDIFKYNILEFITFSFFRYYLKKNLQITNFIYFIYKNIISCEFSK